MLASGVGIRRRCRRGRGGVGVETGGGETVKLAVSVKLFQTAVAVSVPMGAAVDVQVS